MGRIKRTQLQSPSEPKITDDPQSPDKPAYPRRFPRLGSNFQTRVPKTKEPLERPPPVQMSAEFPHVCETERTQKIDLKSGEYCILFFSAKVESLSLDSDYI